MSNTSSSYKLPTLIKYKDRKFLITASPDNLAEYIELLRVNDVKLVVRFCEPTEPQYNVEELIHSGFGFIDLPFSDGHSPSTDQINRWLSILENCEPPSPIAVHCVAGLGRAPLMVAIALIELGLPPVDAICHIRKHRRGCFNRIQLDFIENYKNSHKKSRCCSWLRI
jgi:protein tyrosine phosphatase type 4A